MRKLIILIVLLFAVGCESKGSSDSVKLDSTTLAEAYPGDIGSVDKIELVDGTTGDSQVVDAPAVAQQWIDQVKHIELTPDNNQEGVVGYRFRIKLYEGDEVKLDFLPTMVNDVYYSANSELDKQIKNFFEDQFGREF